MRRFDSFETPTTGQRLGAALGALVPGLAKRVREAKSAYATGGPYTAFIRTLQRFFAAGEETDVNTGGYHENPWVHIGAGALAHAAAQAKWSVTMPTAGGKRISIPDSEVLAARATAGDYLSGQELVQFEVLSLALRGAFADLLLGEDRKPWTGIGPIEKVLPLVVSHLEILADPQIFVKGFRYWRPGSTDSTEYPPESIVWGRLIDPDDLYAGVSPLQCVRREIAGDRQASNFELAFWRNYAVPPLVLSAKDKPIPLDIAKAIEETIVARKSGENLWRPMVLPNALDVVKAGFSMEEAKVFESRKNKRLAILAALMIPPSIGGDYESAHYNTVQGQERHFWGFGVPTFLDVIRGAWAERVVERIHGAGATLDYSLKHIPAIGGTVAERMAAGETAARIPGVRVDEVREIAGFDPIGGEIGNRILMGPGTFLSPEELDAMAQGQAAPDRFAGADGADDPAQDEQTIQAAARRLYYVLEGGREWATTARNGREH